MHRAVGVGVALVAGVALGWAGATLLARDTHEAAVPVPGDWVARAGGEYIEPAQFIEEMQRRGGDRPGQFHTIEQRRALLDDLLYHKALVASARRDGIDRLPEVRRSIDQVLANQVLQRQLRERQQRVGVPEEDARAYHAEHQDDFEVPARRRVAMIHIPVAAEDDQAWQAAQAEAEAARSAALKLDQGVRHFGPLAREYSHDQASRYRGGVIGWLSEGGQQRYRHDPAVLDAAFALQQPGEVSPVLRGADGVYLVRLVEVQPAQSRPFEQLRDGIRQRLLQERLAVVEQEFRQQVLEQIDIEVRERALADIAPLSPPAAPQPPQPPALPSEG